MYQAEISRANPGCFLFLLDQSGSMSDSFGGAQTGRTKADELATIINRLLQTLVIKCSKDEGVRNYFDVGVIGYGARVGPTLGGSLEGRVLVPISHVAESPLRVEDRIQKITDGIGGLVEQPVKFPVWFDPVADDGTPMCQALRMAHAELSSWVDQHPDSFPPIIFNITDGEATDGDPSEDAARLRQLSTRDGDALLFNIHLSSRSGKPLEFVDSEEELPDEFAVRLFRMSSVLPPHLRDAASSEGYQVSDSARGFVFNADAAAVIQFLDIGTRPANLR